MPNEGGNNQTSAIGFPPAVKAALDRCRGLNVDQIQALIDGETDPNGQRALQVAKRAAGFRANRTLQSEAELDAEDAENDAAALEFKH